MACSHPAKERGWRKSSLGRRWSTPTRSWPNWRSPVADLSDLDRIAADADYYTRPRRAPWLAAFIGVLGVVLIAAWCAINGGC